MIRNSQTDSSERIEVNKNVVVYTISYGLHTIAALIISLIFHFNYIINSNFNIRRLELFLRREI